MFEKFDANFLFGKRISQHAGGGRLVLGSFCRLDRSKRDGCVWVFGWQYYNNGRAESCFEESER